MKNSWLSLLVMVLATACAPSIAPAPAASPLSPVSTPSRQLLIAPIQIDQVEVRIVESLPVQVFAHVTGVIGDGCSEAMPVKQTREGNTLTLTINRQRPAEAMCTQIAKIYEETIQLTGDFPPGEYVLKVNDVTQAFTIK
jgi:hypothetical protein